MCTGFGGGGGSPEIVLLGKLVRLTLASTQLCPVERALGGLRDVRAALVQRPGPSPGVRAVRCSLRAQGPGAVFLGPSPHSLRGAALAVPSGVRHGAGRLGTVMNKIHIDPALTRRLGYVFLMLRKGHIGEQVCLLLPRVCARWGSVPAPAPRLGHPLSASGLQ